MLPLRTKPIIDKNHVGVYRGDDVDEQGEKFPPPDAPIARIQNYGGVGPDRDERFDGHVVQFVNTASRFISVAPVSEPFAGEHDYLFCTPDELVPLNDYAREVLIILKELALKESF